MDKTNISNIATNSAGLAIKTSSSALAKTANAILCKIDGNLVASIAAGDLPALTGINIATAYTNAITVSVNASGTFALTAGTAQLTSGLTSGTIFPMSALAQVPAGQALVGYIVIKNATGSTFTGGTTALDASNLTVTYINASGSSLL